MPATHPRNRGEATMKSPGYLLGMPCAFLTAFLHFARLTLFSPPKHWTNIVGILPLLLAGGFAAVSRAGVPVADTTLLPVVTDNLPVITSLTAYVYPND